MQRAAVARWIEGYERAWRAAGVSGLAELFAPQATYLTAPFERPHVGLASIAEMWEAEREGAGEVFEMESELVAIDGATAVARVEVRYGDPVRIYYRDIWIIRFDDAGLCTAFEEWPFWPADGDGGHAGGPRA